MLSIIPKIEQISQRVIRVLGCNPGKMTLQGTNTYIVGTGRERVLIDAGEADVEEYVTTLQECLNKFNISINAVILTHFHHDHTGGIGNLFRNNIINSSTPLYKYPLQEHETPSNAARQAPVKDAYVVAESKNKENDPVYENPITKLQYTFVKDQDVVTTMGASLKLIHTPGHTQDHISLHLEEENAVFSGDCVLGEGTAVFEDLYDYMKSLQLLADMKPDILYPGHGKVVDCPAEHINYYIDHRNKREAQILDCLKQNSRSLESMEIVKQLYSDVPVLLHIVAEKNVHNHLVKLKKEEKVVEDGGKWKSKL